MIVRSRRYRSPGLLVLALGISVTAQTGAVIGYELTRPVPRPVLTIRLDDSASSWDFAVSSHDAAATALSVTGPEGFKVVLAVPAGEIAGTIPQRFAIADTTRDARVTVTAPDGTVWTRKLAVPAKQETQLSVDFTPSRGQVLVTRAGDTAPIVRCSQPRCAVEVAPGTQVVLTAVLGDDATFAGYHQFPIRTPRPLVGLLGDPLAACSAGDAVTAATTGNVFDCAVTVTADTDVAAEFGLQPKEVDVALETPRIEDLIKPLTKQPPAPPTPIDAEKLDDKAIEVALKPPPKPVQIKPPELKPPPEPQKPKAPPPPPPPNMTAVEVKDDKHVVDKAPDDAKQLSDKNRDVTDETRATQTNLAKESEGQAVASRESDDHTSAEVGGPDDKIRQLEDVQAARDPRIKDTDHSGKDEVAKGAIKGEGGNRGEDGTGEKDPGVLAMRGIGGRGKITDNAKDGKKIGKRGTPGINTPMSFQDYERIMGKDRIDEERKVAARKMSSKKGRWERKLDAVKSSLENFVPDVRPGNQTALKTRAHPFAIYLARMHRQIHELWGFGFLEQLDSKGADYPLNDPNLWVNLEVSVNPDGTLHKVTIAKTSGKTEFDVAAVDAVISAGPYEATPEAIRSVDSRIYLRWGFYRNWRQCGTFNAEPYILTDVPDDGGAGALDDGTMVKNVAKLPGSKHRGDRQALEGKLDGKTVTPDDGLAQQKVSPDSSVTDKQALFAANLWVSAFATASVDKLVGFSTVPFYAGGKVVAQNTAELKDMYSGLVVESGPMKDWKLLTPSEYATGGGALPEGNLVLQVRTAKEAFAVVLTRTPSGDYRATQLAR
ncbi:MAG TPA: energy transducer TonB [Kofleriaceae bacterium]|nr:energy transducer TonB [Kofleriaceae bacterium]